MRPTILLFDIDGTLITTGGAGRRALEVAFERRFGSSEACNFRLDGMTDRAIARIGLEAIGATVTQAAIDEILGIYIEVLKGEVARADDKTYRLHEGMLDAVLAGQAERCAIGLGTGNLKLGAAVKLERVGVYHHFAFGGFGCDAEARVEVIRRGAERGADHLGVSLTECRVVVIGDTPKDVAAAQGIGAESIGVGTGSFTPEALLESGATFAFRDLSQSGALEAQLGRS